MTRFALEEDLQRQIDLQGMEDLRQQLAAAEATLMENDEAGLYWCKKAIRLERRAAAEGDRAEGLKVMLENCKAQRKQEEWYKDAYHTLRTSYDHLQEQFSATGAIVARAEAAEAALGQSCYGADSLRLELGLAEARWQKCEAALEPLRWVADMARVCVERTSLQNVQNLRGALAAADAARGKGESENEKTYESARSTNPA